MDSVDQAVKQTGLQNIQLSSTLTQDELQRVITAATVSALKHQEAQYHPRPRSISVAADVDLSAAHGHAAPSWSRTMSYSVLLICTALYAFIAGALVTGLVSGIADTRSFLELLIYVVDVVLQDSGIDEKFLGVTLFALVPNTTEFMNAMSFALNGNIALRWVVIDMIQVGC